MRNALGSGVRLGRGVLVEIGVEVGGGVGEAIRLDAAVQASKTRGISTSKILAFVLSPFLKYARHYTS